MRDCVKQMLVGTAKGAGAGAGESGAPEVLVGRLSALEPERALLLRTATWAVCAMAGRPQLGSPGLVEPAAPETLRPASPQAAVILRELFDGAHPRLLPEALTRLGAAGQHLPPAILPQALDVTAEDLRALVHRVLGTRGLWLSRLNPAWSWGAQTVSDPAGALPADAAARWAEGTAHERVSLLRRARAADPALARQWLDETWSHDKADQRAKLLDTFEVGLGPADEELLQTRLGDRSAGVRALAAELLVRLQTSDFHRRLLDRADRLLDYAPPKGTLGRILKKVTGGPAGRLAVHLPDDGDAEWGKSIGVDKPPTGRGPRSWLLTHMLRLVPPAHWEQRFSATPEALVEAAAAHEESVAVLDGWTLAAVLHGAGSWLLPLWAFWEPVCAETKEVNHESARAFELLRSLLVAMPADAAESGVARRFRQPATGLLRLSWMIPILRTPWSVSFGKQFLNAAHTIARSAGGYVDLDGMEWRESLQTAALALPVACFDEALAPWTDLARDGDGVQPWQRAIAAFNEVIEFRRRIADAIPGVTGGATPAGNGA
jgi:hypothetical protein